MMKLKIMALGVSLAAALVMATGVSAVPVLDGSKTGDGYGAPLAVQTVQTQYGDNLSELDAAYAQIDGGVLYLTLTGNIENNFSTLNVFIDSVAGGENVLTNDANNGGNNPENDGWAQKYAGMQFDTGFAADFMIIMRRGFSQFDFDFATIGGGLSAFEASGNVFGGAIEGSNSSVGSSGIGVAYDNSNIAGVLGGTGAADPIAAAFVLTGIELAIPLSAIGNPTGDILISTMINGANHDFLSNQFLGGLQAGTINLGGDGLGNFTGTVSGVNLNLFPGEQFFRVANQTLQNPVPEPTTIALLGIGLAGLAGAEVRRRRKKKA